jgi:hypothetical protein
VHWLDDDLPSYRPISPARTGNERSDDTDDTSAVWSDEFGRGSSHTTLTIGITPRMRVPARACRTSLQQARAKALPAPPARRLRASRRGLPGAACRGRRGRRVADLERGAEPGLAAPARRRVRAWAVGPLAVRRAVERPDGTGCGRPRARHARCMLLP